LKTFAPNRFSYGTNRYRRHSEDLQICLQAWKHSGLSQQAYLDTMGVSKTLCSAVNALGALNRRVTQRGTKLQAPDGKSRLTDTLDSDGIIALAKHFPTNRAMKFLDWFLYSDTSEDG